jgi:exopolysaccharide production protein ExoZ
MVNSSNSVVQQRIEGLDWLRGLMAISIMFYHYYGRIYGHPDSSTFIGKWAIYGVSTFFVLSGISLAIIYNRFIKGVLSSLKFFVRRIFRILPLMGLATVFILIQNALDGSDQPSFNIVFLNLTTLFGFISPTKYLPLGAWSIGNEMVFYAFTPFIIMLYNWKKWAGNIFVLITWIMGVVFAFHWLNADISTAYQWPMYINPFNQFFLFTSGIFLYYNFKNIKVPTDFFWGYLAFVIGFFLFFPVSGDQINIVTGYNRLVFSIICIFLVFFFWKIDFRLPAIFEKPLASFGIATYSVYLLHPFAIDILQKNLHLPVNINLMILAILITIIVSLIVYEYFEKPFMEFGKRITSVRK